MSKKIDINKLGQIVENMSAQIIRNVLNEVVYDPAAETEEPEIPEVSDENIEKEAEKAEAQPKGKEQGGIRAVIAKDVIDYCEAAEFDEGGPTVVRKGNPATQTNDFAHMSNESAKAYAKLKDDIKQGAIIYANYKGFRNTGDNSNFMEGIFASKETKDIQNTLDYLITYYLLRKKEGISTREIMELLIPKVGGALSLLSKIAISYATMTGHSRVKFNREEPTDADAKDASTENYAMMDDTPDYEEFMSKEFRQSADKVRDKEGNITSLKKMSKEQDIARVKRIVDAAINGQITDHKKLFNELQHNRLLRRAFMSAGEQAQIPEQFLTWAEQIENDEALRKGRPMPYKNSGLPDKNMLREAVRDRVSAMVYSLNEQDRKALVDKVMRKALTEMIGRKIDKMNEAEIVSFAKNALSEKDNDRVYDATAERESEKKKVKGASKPKMAQNVLSKDGVNASAIGRKCRSLDDMSDDGLRSFMSKIARGEAIPSDKLASEIYHAYHNEMSE